MLQDGSLQNGDHLLAIGDVRLWGMGAEQVAAILRQAGQDSIRLVVARPVDPTVPNYLVRTVLTSTKAIKRPWPVESSDEAFTVHLFSTPYPSRLCSE